MLLIRISLISENQEIDNQVSKLNDEKYIVLCNTQLSRMAHPFVMNHLQRWRHHYSENLLNIDILVEYYAKMPITVSLLPTHALKDITNSTINQKHVELSRQSKHSRTIRFTGTKPGYKHSDPATDLRRVRRYQSSEEFKQSVIIKIVRKLTVQKL